MYTAPTCEHRQSCLFMMDDFRFELCGCPNDTQCTGKYSAVHQGTKYSVSHVYFPKPHFINPLQSRPYRRDHTRKTCLELFSRDAFR